MSHAIWTQFPKYCKQMDQFLRIFQNIAKNDKFGHISKMLQKVDQFGHIFHNIAKSGQFCTHLTMQSEMNANIAVQGWNWNSYLILCQSLTISPKILIIIFSQLFFSSAPRRKINFQVVELLLNGSKYDLPFIEFKVILSALFKPLLYETL